MIDQVFDNINRLFVFSFKNGNDDSKRLSFGKYSMKIQELLLLDYYDYYHH